MRLLKKYLNILKELLNYFNKIIRNKCQITITILICKVYHNSDQIIIYKHQYIQDIILFLKICIFNLQS